jgi:hypothetical protein
MQDLRQRRDICLSQAVSAHSLLPRQIIPGIEKKLKLKLQT